MTNREFVLIDGNTGNNYILIDVDTGAAIGQLDAKDRNDAYVKLWIDNLTELKKACGDDISVCWVEESNYTIEELRNKNHRWAESNIGGN